MGEISEILEQNLHLLRQETLNEERSTVSEHAVKEIQSLFSRFGQGLSEREIDFVCSLIFKEDLGILAFLENTTGTKNADNFRDARISALDFLSFVFENFGSRCQGYAIRAKDLCFSLLHRDHYAAVKNMALVAVSKILVSCVGTPNQQKLDLPTMVNKLFTQLSQPKSKLIPTVKQEILCLLGLMAQKYPEYMIAYSNQVKVLFLSELKLMNSKTKKLDRSIIAGCFHGLNGYLHHFTISFDEDQDQSYQIFSYICLAINPSVEHSRYEMTRAALMILVNHAPQFAPFIYDKYEEMYHFLAKWTEHRNSDVKQVAYKALEVCLKVIADQLAERQHSSQVLQFFMLKFKERIQESSYIRDVTIALRGYGVFAAASRLEQSECHIILFDILQRAEHICTSNIVLEEKVQTLPSFLEALASLLRQVKTPLEAHVVVLEKLVIFQMEFFPYIPHNQANYCSSTLSHLFLVMSSKEKIFKSFLSKVVFQGLVRVFSHPNVTEVERTKDLSHDNPMAKLNPESISYINYMELWEGLLRLHNTEKGFTLADREDLVVAVYDEIMNSFMEIMSKLDLASSKTDEVVKVDSKDKTGSSDPLSNLEPFKPKDFRVLVNLVEFSKVLLLESLLKTQVRHFEKWIFTFGMHVIRQSTKLPYVSGFYKLVALCLKLCSQLKYFEEKGGTLFSHERKISFDLFCRFAKATANRLHQYKEDLLAACLQVILALPSQLVASHLKTFIPAVQKAFALGLSYHPLAEEALGSLKSWCTDIPLENVSPYLPQILPHLTKFLTASTSYGKNLEMEVSVLKTNSQRGRQKIPLKIFKPPSKNVKFEESKLTQLQLGILTFLGSLGSKYNSAALLLPNDEISRSAISWDVTHRSHLLFSIPFADLKPQISFDEFLPRVVELAQTASDRQIKIAACELLHSLVLYLVGKGSQDAALQNRKPADKLFKHLFPALMHLSCDIDQVTKELFEPLTFQLIHWFTHKKIINCEETAVIMESIWEGITESEDTALRDLSARCLSEFVKWTIKQSPPKELENSNFNVKAILRRLYSYCLHPSAYKRLGAALAFNSIHTIIREEESLIKTFILEILVHLMDSLTIAHADDDSLGTHHQCKLAIDHAERILREKAVIFDKKQKTTRVPSCLEDGTLASVVRWLLEGCGCRQTEARHKRMELVIKLCLHIPGVENAKSYFQQLLQASGPNVYRCWFEKQIRDPWQQLGGSAFSLQFIQSWMECLLAALDCYSWVFSQQLLSPSDVFEKGTATFGIFEGLIFLLKTLVGGDLETAANHFGKSTVDYFFMPQEYDDYNRSKCTVIVRFLNFLSLSLGKFPTSDKYLSSLWLEDTWKCLALVVLEPGTMGFDVTAIEISSCLPEEMATLLQALKMNTSLTDFFMAELNKQIGLNPLLNINRCLPLSLTDAAIPHFQTMSLLSGYQLLANANLWPFTDITSVCCKLLDSVWNSCAADLSPTSILLGKNVLLLAFALKAKPSLLVTKLLEERGMLVFRVFCPTIATYLAQIASEVVPLFMKNIHNEMAQIVLVDTLDQVARNKSLKDSVGQVVLKETFANWSELSSWWANTETGTVVVLSLLTKMLLIDHSIANNKEPVNMYELYSNLLRSSTNLGGLKGHILDLLSIFVNKSEDMRGKLKSILEEFAVNNFPLRSTEFAIGSSQSNVYIAALRKLLFCLELSGNYAIFEFIIDIFVREDEHICLKEFQSSLQRLLKRQETSRHLALIEVPYNMLCNATLPTQTLSNVNVFVLAPMLRAVSSTTLVSFYAKHIAAIVSIIKEKLPKAPEWKIESSLTAKIGAFQLVEILYSRLPREVIHSMESIINAAYCEGNPKTGKELTKDLTGLAHSAKKEDSRGQNLFLELRRQYHCAAYNTAIAVIASTQTEQKFYTAFLFNDNPVKGEFLWENIVDCERSYTFEIELDAPLERKKKMLSMHPGADGQNSSSTVKYMASQYLADSSLCDDLSQFDFTTSQQMSSQMNQEKKPESDSSESNEFIELEEDALNQHECMATLTALLQNMANRNIIPHTGNDLECLKLLENVKKKLEDNATPKNVKLFLVRFLVNNSEIVKLFSKYLFNTILNAIIAGVFGTELNYFILDALVMILSWQIEPQENCKENYSAILKFMIQKCVHQRKAIFRNNLEIIKIMVEAWKSYLEIPYDVIYSLVGKEKDKAKKDNAFGIQILGIVLANDIPPCNPNQKSLLLELVKNIDNKYKEVYAAAAEVSGMVLKYMKEHTGSLEETFEEALVKSLSEFGDLQKGQFIMCLNKICLHYPSFADRFVKKLLFMLPTIHGTFCPKILEIIHARVHQIEGGFKELKSVQLLTMLEHREEEVQLICLRIILKLLDKLETDSLLMVLPIVQKKHLHPSNACRDIVYQIFMDIYDKFRSSDGAKDKEVTRIAKDTLLLGLVDSEKSLRLMVSNFWSNETHLPAATAARLSTVLAEMYSSASESQFLQYTTFLILELSSRSPDFIRSIFDRPLSDCQFQSYTVSTSWRQRHAAMTPMFADTQSLGGSTSMSFSSESLGIAGVRATQNMPQFTPTQDLRQSRTFDWLTQSSVDTRMDWQSAEPSGGSSVLFAVGRADSKVVQRKGQDERGQAHGKIDFDVRHIRTRFMKETSQTSGYYAMREKRRAERREEMAKERQASRDAVVTIYRQYRIGELPDIEIPHSAIITPLQALAQCDAKIAQMLMRCLTNGIIEEVKVRNPQSHSTFCRDISSALNNILQLSNTYCPTVIGFVLELMYEQILNVNLNPEDVSTAAQASNHQNLGILVLETYLNYLTEIDKERPSKKAKREVLMPSQKATVWIKLAELYRSCNNYDMVHGVFSQSIELNPETKNALTLEARGEYKSSLQIFIKLYEDQTDKAELQQAEIDLWDDAIMECYHQLTKWDSLHETVLSRVSGEQQKFWQDSFYQEHYLPHFVHSSLKLMMEKEGGNSLFKFVEDAMLVKESKMMIESHYMEELALLNILNKDYNRARYYISSALRKFLQEWASLSVLTSGIRHQKLHHLQELTEVQDFLNFMAKNDNFSDTKSVKRMLARWLQRLPSFINDACIWDNIISNRSLYIGEILDKLKGYELCNAETTELVDQDLVQMKLAFVNCACNQGNLPVALKHLKWIRSKGRRPEEQIKCVHAYSHVQHQLSLELEGSEKLKNLVHVHEQLAKIEKYIPGISESSPVMIEHKLLLSQTLQMLAETPDSVDSYPEAELGKLLSAINCRNLDQLVSTLLDKSYHYLLDAANTACKKTEAISSAQMKLANFCNLHLQQIEENVSGNCKPSSIDEYPKTLMDAVLGDMKSGNASFLFPRLLQVIENFPECIRHFIQKSGEIPCWMFVNWINQIVVLLDKPQAEAVQPIVERLAQTYENALVYPFMLSSEGFNFSGNDGNKAFVDRVRVFLRQKLPLTEDFVSALQFLGVPHRLFKDAMEGIVMAKKQKNNGKMLQIYKEMWEELFERNLSKSNTYSNCGRGQLFADFANKYASQLQSKFGNKGTLLQKMSASDIQAFWTCLYAQMDDVAKKMCRTGKLKLKDMSSWLNDFQLVKNEHQLEIPGQYTGKNRPFPEHHVKISGFDQSVLVLTSLAQPRRLTIRGDDEKEYNFLVKAGEDLRQDNRIEHMFEVMNEIYARDASCAARRLHLVTYKVIPLTTRIGLIEWVNNTKVLKEFLLAGVAQDEKNELLGSLGPSNLHNNWVLESTTTKHPPPGLMYGNMYKCKKYKETVEKHHQKVASVPQDLLRRSFLKMSSTPEAFLTLREQFCTSHAVLCISQWLLGIGDRHLSNFLVCMDTGSELGIDFGHAFGSATQFLPVPELIPFRLTQQYLNVMQPLYEKGLLEATMVHTLAALRKNHNILLTMLDIFIKEPTLDWQNFAMKQQASGMATEDSKEDNNWYPKQRISFARRKLEGVNPYFITGEELLLGHSSKDTMPYFKEVCDGTKDQNIRARLPNDGLSAEEQVSCLIDQATDPNVLGRTWGGWEPWM